MATSGALSTNNDNIKYKITINQNSQNVSSNTSSVTVSVRVYRTNTGYTTYGTGTIYCKINGTTYSESITSDDKITSSGITLFTKTLNISHGADGSKKLTVSSWISHSQFSSSEQSYSLNLTTIPRATTPTVNVSSLDMGGSVTISMPRASSSFTHTLKYSFGKTSGTIGTGLGTSKAWTVPLSLASQIPNTTSGSCVITCETYNGSTKIGSKNVTITLKVPSSVVPTINSVVIDETVTGLASKFGGFLKDKSKPKVTINTSGAYSSTISSISSSISGKTYSGSSFTLATFPNAGSYSLSITVTDSRGRKATASRSITIVDYVNPIINSLTVERANSDGTPNDEGASLLVKYKFAIASVSNKNDKSYTLAIKGAGDSAYTTLAEGSVYSIDTSLIVSENISIDESYSIRLSIKDYFRTVTHTVEASTAFTLIDFHSSGKGLAFGKVAQEEDIVEFGLPVKFNNGETPEGARIIPPNTDINTLLEPGYYVFSSATSSTLINLPFSTSGSGSIEVIREGEANQVRQVITRCSANREIWERIYYSNTWQSTHLIYKGGNRVLWSGGYYMTGTHKIALSELISKQPNGIVLVFSVITSGTIENSGFNSFFISKHAISLHNGNGHSFFLTGWGGMSLCGYKYLYINDDSIAGNDDNNKIGEVNGITLASNRFVLRYVIGV